MLEYHPLSSPCDGNMPHPMYGGFGGYMDDFGGHIEGFGGPDAPIRAGFECYTQKRSSDPD